MNGTSKHVGVILFCVGMAALVVVFVLAAVTFSRLPAQIANTKLVADQGVGRILAAAAVKALFLLVMTYAASLIASKGLDLYHTARPKED